MLVVARYVMRLPTIKIPERLLLVQELDQQRLPFSFAFSQTQSKRPELRSHVGAATLLLVDARLSCEHREGVLEMEELEKLQDELECQRAVASELPEPKCGASEFLIGFVLVHYVEHRRPELRLQKRPSSDTSVKIDKVEVSRCLCTHKGTP